MRADYENVSKCEDDPRNIAASALIRSWTVPVPVDTGVAEDSVPPRKSSGERSSRPFPSRFLVFDTETSTELQDHQKLLMGTFILAERSDIGRYRTLAHGFIYNDDLPIERRDEFEVLRRFAGYSDDGSADDSAALSAGFGNSVSADDEIPTVLLLSRSQFVSEFLIRRCADGKTAVVGFNLPYDLSRLASGWHRPKRDRFVGGFALHLGKTSTGRDCSVLIKKIDQKKAFIRLAISGPNDRAVEVPFVDVKTLFFAMTSRSTDLRTVANVLGIEQKGHVSEYGRITAEMCEYAIRDTVVTAQAYCELCDRLARLGVGLRPDRAYSAASIDKACASTLGISNPLRRFTSLPNEILGYAMAAFYGGRSECNITGVPLPVAVCDFKSEYPSVRSLMGLWDFDVAEDVKAVDVTDEAIQFVDSVTLDDLYDKATWRQLRTFVQVLPDGDRLPFRSKYGDSSAPVIGDNYVLGTAAHCGRDYPMWYAMADVVASKIRCAGKVPTILRAVSLEPTRALSLPDRIVFAGHVVRSDRDLAAQFIELRIESQKSVKLMDKASPIIEKCADPSEIHRLTLKLADELRVLTASMVDSDEVLNRLIALAANVLNTDDAGYSDRKSLLLAHLSSMRMDAFIADLALKITANAAYGVTAQLNHVQLNDDLAKNMKTAKVWVFGRHALPWECSVPVVEEPGAMCFPPSAAWTTAGARLMLAMAEVEVYSRGGAHVYCDTDSIAVVACEERSVLPCKNGNGPEPDTVLALSYADVGEITERFESLWPYDEPRDDDSAQKIASRAAEADRKAALSGSFSVPGICDAWVDDQRLLKVEKIAHCLAVSPKRYCLFRYRSDGTAIIIEGREHGLGWLVNPFSDPSFRYVYDSDGNVDESLLPEPNWDELKLGDDKSNPRLKSERSFIRTTYIHWIWRQVLSKYGVPFRGSVPSWFGRPAVTQFTATTPALLRQYGSAAATSSESGAGAGDYDSSAKPFNFVSTMSGRLVSERSRDRRFFSPYESDAGMFERIPWFEMGGPNAPLSIEDIIHRTAGTYAEKFAFNYDRSTYGDVVGFRFRRNVVMTGVVHIGKEVLDEDEDDIGVSDEGDKVEYRGDDSHRYHRPSDLISLLRSDYSLSAIASMLGIPERTVKNYAAGALSISDDRYAALRRLAYEHVSGAAGSEPGDWSAAFANARIVAVRRCESVGCSNEVRRSNARFCSDSCRYRSSRQTSSKGHASMAGVIVEEAEGEEFGAFVGLETVDVVAHGTLRRKQVSKVTDPDESIVIETRSGKRKWFCLSCFSSSSTWSAGTAYDFRRLTKKHVRRCHGHSVFIVSGFLNVNTKNRNKDGNHRYRWECHRCMCHGELTSRGSASVGAAAHVLGCEYRRNDPAVSRGLYVKLGAIAGISELVATMHDDSGLSRIKSYHYRDGFDSDNDL